MGRPSQCNPCCGVPCTSSASAWDDDFSTDTVSQYNTQQFAGVSPTWSISGGQLSGSALGTGSDTYAALYRDFDLSTVDSATFKVLIEADIPSYATSGDPSPIVFINPGDTGAAKHLCARISDGLGGYLLQEALFGNLLGSTEWWDNQSGGDASNDQFMFTSSGGTADGNAGTIAIKCIGYDNSERVGFPISSSQSQLQFLWNNTVKATRTINTPWSSTECNNSAGMLGHGPSSRLWNAFRITITDEA